MNALARDPQVASRYPMLVQAANAVASYQIRNRATIGGNVCNASPCADTSPATLALEAEMVLHGLDGARRVPAAAFFLGPGQTAIRESELLTAIRFPPPPAGAAGHYLKLGRCRAGDLALVGVAVLGFPDGTQSGPAHGYHFRIALGSVAPVPLRVTQAETVLATHPPDEEAFGLAAREATAAASPITDVRGSSAYQRAMVGTLTQRALRHVWAQLGRGG
jgi:carbon-monoxide dehydrogenase medium subunit